MKNIYVEAWNKTFGPGILYMLKAPFLLAKHTHCFVVHQAAGYWRDNNSEPSNGWCTLCGRNDNESGMAAFFTVLLEIGIVMIAWTALALLRKAGVI